VVTPLRVGFVGAGRWAVVHHLPGLAEHPDAELAAVFDPDASRAREVARRFGGVVADDVPTLLEVVDAVVVASPPAAHHEAGAAALERGLPVLVEKPMTITAADAWDLVARADQNATPLMVGYTFEFTSTSDRVVEAVRELGDLVIVDGVYASAMRHLFDGSWPFDVSDPLAVPQAATFADPRVSGGGQARGQLTHLLASALRATGCGAVAVSALFRPEGEPVDLHNVLSVDFGTLVASIASTCALPPAHPPAWELRYVGEGGTVIHDLATGVATIRQARGDVVELAPLAEAERYPSRAVVQRFVDVVLGRGENPATGRLGAEVASLLDAAYRSAADRGSPQPVERPDLRT
jgi:predicted dehydrogenase